MPGPTRSRNRSRRSHRSWRRIRASSLIRPSSVMSTSDPSTEALRSSWRSAGSSVSIRASTSASSDDGISASGSSARARSSSPTNSGLPSARRTIERTVPGAIARLPSSASIMATTSVSSSWPSVIRSPVSVSSVTDVVTTSRGTPAADVASTSSSSRVASSAWLTSSMRIAVGASTAWPMTSESSCSVRTRRKAGSTASASGVGSTSASMDTARSGASGMAAGRCSASQAVERRPRLDPRRFERDAEQRSQDGHRHGVGRQPVERLAAGEHDGEVETPADDLDGEPALADARLARDHDHRPVTLRCRIGQTEQRRQLGRSGRTARCRPGRDRCAGRGVVPGVRRRSGRTCP